MKPYILLTFITITTLTFSCKKPTNGINNTYTNEMIIGMHPGFAPAGSPSYYYLINSTGVYQDTTNTKLTVQQYKFDYKLSDAKYNQVKSILKQIPDALLKENGQHYRSPYAADCGTNSVTTTINGATYTWTIEECTDSMPTYVKPFADNLNAVTNILRQ